jgi:hypothetical protein
VFTAASSTFLIVLMGASITVTIALSEADKGIKAGGEGA